MTDHTAPSRIDTSLVVKLQLGSGYNVKDAQVMLRKPWPNNFQEFGMAAPPPDGRPFNICCDGRFARINDPVWCETVTEYAMIAIEDYEKEQLSKSKKKELQKRAEEDSELVSWES